MKSIRNWIDKDVPCFQDADLAKLKPVFEKAEALWFERQREFVAKHGDVGTCVLGAGITVRYLPPRKRKPVYLVVVHPPGAAQGASTWEASKGEIIEFLHKNGIDEAHYCPGFMD